MLTIDYTTELLGLKDIEIKKVTREKNATKIEIEKRRYEHKCPCCGSVTSVIHDYRTQEIKDIPAFGNNVIFVYRKRRYRCPECGKRFYEKNAFLPRYHRMTNRLAAYVIKKLGGECSFTSVAREINLSISTVIRIFDLVNKGRPKMPEVLSIDEFKGNTGREKYQVILTDPKNRTVLDILPSRNSTKLYEYFKPSQRDNVRYIVSDMWKPYCELSSCFHKATLVIDRYHYIRQVIWAIEAVRKEEQKRFAKSRRIYFKHSKRLLIKRFKCLSEDEKREVLNMLGVSPELSHAHALKETFLNIAELKDRDSAARLLKEWISDALMSGIRPFEKCANTIAGWSVPILNSFEVPYSNGFTEGCNNRIKVLKRNAYGYKNFDRFRNRILYMFESSSDTEKVASS